MMNIAICDDEKSVVEFICEELTEIQKKLGHAYTIEKYYSGHDLLDDYNYKYDMIFLDIRLIDSDGFEICKLIRNIDPDVLIVFLTSIPEYVFEAYKVTAFRYILKENFKDEAQQLMEDAHQRLKVQKPHVVIKQGTGNLKLFCEEILYVASDLRKLTFFVQGNTYVTYGKLSDFEEELERCKFIRVHQGYLVNSQYIKTLTSDSIILDNNKCIPISRNRTNEVKKKVMEYMK